MTKTANNKVLEIGTYAFSDCSNLASIHLPSNLKKYPKERLMDANP